MDHLVVFKMNFSFTVGEVKVDYMNGWDACCEGLQVVLEHCRRAECVFLLLLMTVRRDGPGSSKKEYIAQDRNENIYYNDFFFSKLKYLARV